MGSIRRSGARLDEGQRRRRHRGGGRDAERELLPMKSLFRLARAALFGSALNLRPYERLILDDAHSILDRRESELLQAQLGALQTVQRTLEDRMVQMFFARSAPWLTSAGKEEFELLRGHLILPSDGKRERRIGFRVVLWNGLLSTIEFGRSPRGIDLEAVRVVYAAESSSDPKLSEVADRFEHGGGRKSLKR